MLDNRYKLKWVNKSTKNNVEINQWGRTEQEQAARNKWKKEKWLKSRDKYLIKLLLPIVNRPGNNEKW